MIYIGILLLARCFVIMCYELVMVIDAIVGVVERGYKAANKATKAVLDAWVYIYPRIEEKAARAAYIGRKQAVIAWHAVYPQTKEKFLALIETVHHELMYGWAIREELIAEWKEVED